MPPSLYDTLEQEVVPLFFDRDASGLPRGWIERMKRSIMSLAWRYNADRMVTDYVAAQLPAGRRRPVVDVTRAPRRRQRSVVLHSGLRKACARRQEWTCSSTRTRWSRSARRSWRPGASSRSRTRPTAGRAIWRIRRRGNNEVHIQLKLKQTDAKILQAIEEALVRIDKGTYGVCRDCGEPIAQARLEAIPWTRVCKTCKEKQSA